MSFSIGDRVGYTFSVGDRVDYKPSNRRVTHRGTVVRVRDRARVDVKWDVSKKNLSVMFEKQLRPLDAVERLAELVEQP